MKLSEVMPAIPGVPTKKSVVDGKLIKTSVSMVKTFSLCERKWALRYVFGLPDKQTAAKDTGTKVHSEIERYLKHGDNTLGAIARRGLHLIPKPTKFYVPTGKLDRNGEPEYAPPPGADLFVEEWFGKPSPLVAEGVPFDGYIDLVNTRRLKTEGVMELIDWKTTKDLKWAAKKTDLKSAQFEHGVQMVGYAAWVLQARTRFPHVATFNLKHVYFPTAGSAPVTPVEVSADLSEIGNEWDTISHRVARMKLLAGEDDSNKVPVPSDPAKLKAACNAYGGCPYLGTHCRPNERVSRDIALGFTGGEKGMSLLKKTSKPAEPISQSSAPAPSAPTASAPVQAPKKKGIIDDQSTIPDAVLKAQQEAKPKWIQNGLYKLSVGGAVVPAKFLCMTETGGSFIPLAGGTPIKVPLAHAAYVVPMTDEDARNVDALITPPDMPASDPVKASIPVSPEHLVELPPAVQEHIKAQQTQQTAAAPEPKAEAAPEKPKRGRPSKPKTASEPTATVEEPEAKDEEIRIYVDCIPPEEFDSLDRYVAARHLEVCEASGKPDARLVEYGAGKGALAARCREVLPSPGRYVVMSGEIANIVVEAIAPYAKVTRGIR